ncbi:hypothetical protein DB330_06270 [Lacticaseibacillus casei]|nr:hypothetical protein DB330_06270 [Lacticaseibacillus casei]PTU98363.1 hypothetical protein DB326_06215 [Lacticaseibacillus casei]
MVCPKISGTKFLPVPNSAISSQIGAGDREARVVGTTLSPIWPTIAPLWHSYIDNLTELSRGNKK